MLLQIRESRRRKALGKVDKDTGIYTDGDMYLHKGGLNAAWAAAQGARTGKKASTDVISHLNKHRKALGLTKLQHLQSFAVNMPLRTEEFEGREHLVAPVVAIVEGVHNELFYPIEEIGKFEEAWNGVPLLVGHPSDANGYAISANNPKVIEEKAVGRFWNAYVEDTKLKGEIWIDVKKAKEVAPAVLDIIRGDGQLEVSTGLWTEDEDTSGEWHGEKYRAIMRGHRPDHLALLPGGEGACSWDDGCGVRVNEKKGGENLDEELFEKLEEMGKESGEAPGRFKRMFTALAHKLGFKTSEISHSDIYSRLSDMIGGDGPVEVGSEGPYRYVNSVFDNYFIYEEHAEGEPSKLFRQDYRINADDEIQFVDDPVPVKREVRYVKLQAKKEVMETMSKEKEKCCEELINSLIANDAVQLSEDDREWLESLDEDHLKKLEPVVKEPETNEKSTEKEEQELKVQQAAEKGLEEALNSGGGEKEEKAMAEPQTAEEFIANAPEGIRETLERSYKRDQELKANLVKSLLDNKRNVFTKEQLESKTMDELEALTKLADVPVDYSGQGGEPVQNEIKDNERHEDGTGVPDVPKMKWNKAGNE